MKSTCLLISYVFILLTASEFLPPLSLATAETLSDIDQEIQTNQAIVTDRGGLDAYNIYAGVTTSRLDRKISILQDADIHPRFYQTGAGVTDYTNFYSFTSRPGVTDTSLALVTPNSTLRLYRRGNSGYQEALGYLGSWWGDQYRGIQEARDEQAILAAWGSDLQRIYVIDVPAGNTLIGGLASPMEKDGEYRQGGAYQYYYRGAPSNWLVYALYAPDYLKSYSGAVVGAQRVGRSIATDLGVHLDQTRYGSQSHHADAGAGQEAEGELWMRGFGDNIDYDEKDGSSVDAHTAGMSMGWQRMLEGNKPGGQSRSYWGVMFGIGDNFQEYETSAVENSAKATVGGIYGLYVSNPESPRAWYGSCSLLHGGLRLNNTVPGELGYGLSQDYDGDITVLTVQNGIVFRKQNGWSIEPHQQFSYTKIGMSDFNDNLGARVSLKQGDSLWGRFGVEVRKVIENAPDNQVSVWTKISCIHNFFNRNEVSVAGDTAASELDQNSYVLAIGTDFKLNQRLSLQGQVAEVFDGENGVQGNLSLKYNW
jgi:outer membrane autotransporter protein